MNLISSGILLRYLMWYVMDDTVLDDHAVVMRNVINGSVTDEIVESTMHIWINKKNDV